jgi:hypothetical protein
MAKKKYAPEQIINKLREAEILLSQGVTIAVARKRIEVSDHTYEQQLADDIIALAAHYGRYGYRRITV